jgi:hypothetical protein
LVAGPFKLSALSHQPSALSFFVVPGRWSVSKSNVKALRYSLLLPLIHLAISVPVIYLEEALYWRFIPRIQIEEDFEKTAPRSIFYSGPMIAWNPCYEYRPSIADRFIFAVEFPAGMLIAPHGASGCNPTLLRPILQKLKNWMRVQPRIVLLDSLLLLGIAGQWWLVGHWIDRLRKRRKHTNRWIIPVVTITICGIVVAAASFRESRPWEFVAFLLPLMALLAWLTLILMFSVTAVHWAWFRRKNLSSSTPTRA